MRIQIDTEDARLISDLMQPGASQSIPGGATLTIPRIRVGKEATDEFLLTFGVAVDQNQVAAWLFEKLAGRATALRINYTDVPIDKEKITRFLNGRNIVLCSDGTGNAGGKTRGTNVWRIFNDLDWHNQQVQQLTFYNDGVGTDDWRLFKILGGAFGWGLSRNIIELYSFAALNYRPGDRLYLFGFSRGAFTVRALAGMIMKCGLLKQESYLTSTRSYGLVKDILRAYQEDGTTQLTTLQNDRATEFYSPMPIEMIGVWDTVDAVAVPVNELRLFLNGISKTLFKRRLYDFRDCDLNPHVEHGYQALAIDDERKTFHPNVWNAREGIEQVWFAGAHSNVGGGYPKDGMAHVALDWMMGKAAQCGLRFDPDARDQVRRKADAHAKLYDARTGLGVFYRYAPRNLKPHDSAEPPQIHASVYDRVKRRTARYGPIVIPENAECATTDAGPYSTRPDPLPGLTGTDRDRIAPLVRMRERLYWMFVTFSVFVVAIVVVLLLFQQPTGEPVWPAWISSFLKFFLPAPLESAIDIAGRYPFQAAGAVGVLVFLRRLSTAVKRAIQQEAFQAWRHALHRAWKGHFTAGVTPAHRVIDLLRRVVLPRPVTAVLVAMALLLVLIDMPQSLATAPEPVGGEPHLPPPASGTSACLETRGTCVLEVGGSVPVSVRADRPENFTGIVLEQGGRYQVQYLDRTNWSDGRYAPPPAGFDFGRNVFRLRRFWWMERLRPHPDGHWFQVVGHVGGSRNVFPALNEDPTQPLELEAGHSGELVLFVNDVPYGNNRGVMTLQLRRLD